MIFALTKSTKLKQWLWWMPVVLAAGVVGCASTTKPGGPSTGTKSSQAATPEPKRTNEADQIARLVSAWRAQGLKAEAQYAQLPGKPADRIEWQTFEVFLSLDVAQSERVSRSVGEFAARSSRPVLVSLYVRNRKQDAVLSQALKQGALESGGRNSVKLDHYIGPENVAKIRVSVRETR